MFFFSSSYILYMIPAFILVMLAQLWVKSTYRKWSQVKNYYGMTGADAAQRLLRSGNLLEVSTSFTGIIDGIDMSSSEVLLTSGSRTIRLDEVISINSPPTP